MPYVFKEKNKFHMIFNRRSGDYKTNYYIEDVLTAISDDRINWTIIDQPILKPELEWEGREVENRGILKHKEIFLYEL